MDPIDALSILSKGKPLVGVSIDKVLDFRVWGTDQIHVPITLENCVFTSLEAPFCHFDCPVNLVNTKILRNASFFSSYFFHGLYINKCEFMGEVDFQCGGHNKGQNAVKFENTRFEGFVNFFDCWYEGPFYVKECNFKGGTNLLGNKGQSYQVQFDVPPIIEGNEGRLDKNGG